MEKQAEEQQRIMESILDGILTESDDIPLLRRENEDGTVSMKMTDALMPIVMFLSWLNEKAEGTL